MSIIDVASLSPPFACRDYELVLSDGSLLGVTISLCDLEANTAVGRFARAHHAVACGFVAVTGGPDSPEHPIVWVVDASSLILATEEGERPVSSELEVLIGEYLGLFFVQIAPYAPELGDIQLAPVHVANDN